MRIILVLLLYQSSLAESEKIRSFFLQHDYSFLVPSYTAGLDMECVHTKQNNTLVTKPLSITLCFRSFPITWQLSIFEQFWMTIVGFGNIKEDFSDMDQGYLFGIWETGPWLAYKDSDDTVHEWVSLGQNAIPDFQIWRHSCIAINFETGDITLVENGNTRFRVNSQKLVRLRRISFVSAGCYYKSSGYMSMHGRVTDLQMYSKELTEEDMKMITNCEDRTEGDVISWGNTEWVVSGKNKTLEETLNMDKDV